MNKIIGYQKYDFHDNVLLEINNKAYQFSQLVFQSFSYFGKRTVIPFYRNYFHLIYNWASVSVNDLRLTCVEELPFPVNKVSKKIFYVGDIHGETNHLMLNLLYSGVARFKPKKDPLILYDPIHKRTYPFNQISIFQKNNASHIQALPNLEYCTNNHSKLIILGDILDRGPHLNQCLHLLLYLANQQKEFLYQHPMFTKTLIILFGDHEIYGLNPTVGLSPHYCSTYLPSVIKQSNQHSLSLIHDVLNTAFKDKLIQYAHYEPGHYMAHSAITRPFINQMIESLNNENFAPLYEKFDVVKKCEFLNNLNDLYQNKNNSTSLPNVIDFLNELFVELAMLLNDFSNQSITDRIKLMSHPMITINDNHYNPIWVRPFDEESPRNIAGIGIIGHTSSKSGLCKTVYSPLSRSYLIGVDIQASWLYRINAKPCHARARLIYSDPETGHLLHMRLSNEKYSFFEGEFRPSENKHRGIFYKLKKYIMGS